MLTWTLVYMHVGILLGGLALGEILGDKTKAERDRAIDDSLFVGLFACVLAWPAVIVFVVGLRLSPAARRSRKRRLERERLEAMRETERLLEDLDIE